MGLVLYAVVCVLGSLVTQALLRVAVEAKLAQASDEGEDKETPELAGVSFAETPAPTEAAAEPEKTPAGATATAAPAGEAESEAA